MICSGVKQAERVEIVERSRYPGRKMCNFCQGENPGPEPEASQDHGICRSCGGIIDGTCICDPLHDAGIPGSVRDE